MQGPENKNKRRVDAYYLACIKMVGLVCSWRQEKTDRNCGHKYRPFCVCCSDTKYFLTKKK